MQHILEKGMNLIFENGFHSVGLQKILDAAGIPKGSFYHYFKSKEDFGLQMIDFYADTTLHFLSTFLENEQRNPRERIFDLLKAVTVIYQEENYSRGCFLGNCSLELAAQKSSYAAVISGNFDKWQALFAKTIKEGQEQGNIKKEHSPEEYAGFLINSWEGALVRMKSTKNGKPMELLIHFMEQLI